MLYVSSTHILTDIAVPRLENGGTRNKKCVIHCIDAQPNRQSGQLEELDFYGPWLRLSRA